MRFFSLLEENFELESDTFLLLGSTNATKTELEVEVEVEVEVEGDI